MQTDGLLERDVEFCNFENIIDAVAYLNSAPPVYLGANDLPQLGGVTHDVHRIAEAMVPDNANHGSIESQILSEMQSVEPSVASSDSVVAATNPIAIGATKPTACPRKRKRGTDTAQVQLATKASKAWESMLARLQEYKEQHGTLDVSDDNEDDKDLLRWITDQRRSYRALKGGLKSVGGMTKEKMRRLADLGFDFRYYSWDDRYQQLKTFQELNSVAAPEFETLLSSQDPALYRWFERQRSQYRAHCKGKISKLTSPQVHQLKALGFSATAPMVDEEFEEMFQELLRYKKIHGNCNVPTSDTTNTKLGRWIVKQRIQYRKLKEGKGSHLTAERIIRLTDAGFVFCPKGKIPTWDDRLDMLREKFARDGHIRYPKTEQAMRSWITRIRKEYESFQQGKKSLLTQSMIDQLNELGMVWVTGFPSGTPQAPRKPWNERIEELQHFIREHGHSIVPQATPGLGQWVHTQRVEYKKLQKGEKSLLTAERALQLVELGFCFDAMKRRGKVIDADIYR